ncbi:MAG TPA: cytidine deaminase [Bacteroidales bacterium]|jgi:cytidine deaminase|nr:cytidine deaminase [Bacteroidales bacterium]
MKRKSLNIQYKEYSNTNDLPEEYKLLAQKAKEAVKTSYSPYSEFAVGAALLLENGEFILGSNQENGAYPSGLCAERVALFCAGTTYPNVPVDAMAIAASYKGVAVAEPIAPCGACRQVMIETQNIGKRPYKVIMIGANKTVVVDNVSFLLPFTFSDISNAVK